MNEKYNNTQDPTSISNDEIEILEVQFACF